MKKLACAIAALLPCSSLMAGGLVTNTNQNAAFLRQLSQEAIIDITGLYMNPAGTAFLAPGGHISVNIQNAKQSRDISTSFPLFKMNLGNPNASHDFAGDAYAPVIPSIQYSHNWEKWSINANFSLGGGGGKCEFEKGLGSFEALYAGQLVQLVPAAVNAQLPVMAAGALMQASIPAQQANALAATGSYNSQLTGYTLNAYMKGRQYYFGLSLGATYKVLDNLAVFAGLRGVYATNNYNGYVQDIKAKYAYSIEIPAIEGAFPGLKTNGTGEQPLDDRSLTLNTDQTGFGLTPMLGIDWRINDQWNIAAKYEFKTRLRLKNDSEMNDFAAQQAATNPVLGQFADGSKIAADIPSLFTVGVQYSPIQALRLQTGFHLFGDKSATQYDNKQDKIDGNTWEITAGVEYDVCRWLTLSCGWQKTSYDLSDAYMNDLSFVTNSNSWGCGARLNLAEKWALDLGFMYTNYEDRTVDTVAGTLPTGQQLIKSDTYSRTNRVFGIGLNYCF